MSQRELVLNLVTLAKHFPGAELPIGICQMGRWVWLTAEEIQRLYEWAQAQQQSSESP